MKIRKEAELNQYIKTDGINGIFLLYGGEEYLINAWKNTLIKHYKDDSFNYTALDGSQMNLDELYENTQQLPMFAEKRCVLFENIDYKKLTKDPLEKLTTIFEDNPESTILIITAPLIDSKLATAKKLIDLADKYGTAIELEPRTTDGLIKYIQSILKKSGSSISSANAKDLIRLCSADMQKLTTETSKLAAYAQEREVTSDDIDKIVVPTIEERIFDLSKMIVSGNFSRALEITKNLTDLKESPVMIISTLIMSYTDLYRAKVAQHAGMSSSALGTLLGYRGNQFRLQNAYNTHITLNAVEHSLDVLLKTDTMLKSSPVSDELLLEKTVLELIYIKES